MLPSTSLGSIESKVGVSYWSTAVDEGLATDDEILEALSVGARVGIATGLLVSAQARDMVSERLARRFERCPNPARNLVTRQQRPIARVGKLKRERQGRAGRHDLQVSSSRAAS